MQETAAATEPKALDPLHLILNASGPVLAVLVFLFVAALGVWVIWVLKALQLRRLSGEQRAFERNADGIDSAGALISLALQHRTSPGGRVVLELAKRHQQRNLSLDLMLGVAKRAIANEQQRVSTLMPTLSSIASASPFVGLLGTVYGIVDAFVKIGVEKSASLPVVAPAIGEALIATAFGLAAAIPATIAFNYVDKRITDLLEELSASAESWAALMVTESSHTPAQVMPLMRESARPMAR